MLEIESMTENIWDAENYEPLSSQILVKTNDRELSCTSTEKTSILDMSEK